MWGLFFMRTILWWMCKIQIYSKAVFSVSKIKWKSIKCWEDYETRPWLCHGTYRCFKLKKCNWCHLYFYFGMNCKLKSCCGILLPIIIAPLGTMCLFSLPLNPDCAEWWQFDLQHTKEIHTLFKRFFDAKEIIYLPSTATQPLLKDRSSMAITSYGSLLLNISPLITTCTHYIYIHEEGICKSSSPGTENCSFRTETVTVP